VIDTNQAKVDRMIDVLSLNRNFAELTEVLENLESIDSFSNPKARAKALHFYAAGAGIPRARLERLWGLYSDPVLGGH
jgi:hypothetical protein